MRNAILMLMICSVTSSLCAQEAVQAYANKDDTFLLFSTHGLDMQKKYVLFSLWNPRTPDADLHTTQFNTIKTDFSDYDNIEFRDIKWNRESDIQSALQKYGIEVTVDFGKHIRMKGDEFMLNTSSANAFFFMEENKAAFLCSGSICGKKVKEFFRD